MPTKTLKEAVEALNAKYTKDGKVTPAILEDMVVAGLIGVEGDAQKPTTPKSMNMRQFFRGFGSDDLMYMIKVIDGIKEEVKQEEQERLAKEKKAIIARKMKEMNALEAELKALLEE